MYKFLLTLGWLWCSWATTCFAQSDMLSLQKKGISIQHYSKGSYIKCLLKNGVWVTGYILQLKNDSVTLKPFHIVQFANPWGTASVDTQWLAIFKFHHQQIIGFPKSKYEGFIYIKNGALFKGGAVLYTLVNLIGRGGNAFEPRNLVNLGIAAAFFTAGVILKQQYKPYYPIGKKYTTRYTAL